VIGLKVGQIEATIFVVVWVVSFAALTVVGHRRRRQERDRWRWQRPTSIRGPRSLSVGEEADRAE
jgi:hypothetical protein